jgi:hypothetical protein
MTKTHKALRSDSYSASIEIAEIDGIALSAEEVNLAKLVVDKLARTGKGSVIDFSRASKRRLKRSRSRNPSW